MNRKAEGNGFSWKGALIWIVTFQFVNLFRVILHEATQRQKNKNGSSKQDNYFNAFVTYIIPGSSVVAKCYLVNGKWDTISSKKTNALKFN